MNPMQQQMPNSLPMLPNMGAMGAMLPPGFNPFLAAMNLKPGNSFGNIELTFCVFRGFECYGCNFRNEKYDASNANGCSQCYHLSSPFNPQQQ
jgi:hypothetical protein